MYIETHVYGLMMDGDKSNKKNSPENGKNDDNMENFAIFITYRHGF